MKQVTGVVPFLLVSTVLSSASCGEAPNEADYAEEQSKRSPFCINRAAEIQSFSSGVPESDPVCIGTPLAYSLDARILNPDPGSLLEVSFAWGPGFEFVSVGVGQGTCGNADVATRTVSCLVAA